jgi:very-short-patch-repair endonuclease
MEQLNNKKSLKEVRRVLRNSPTQAEFDLWQHLKGRQLLGMKFRRQHSFGDFVMDFYCPEARLAIELDGAPHYTEEGILADKERDEILESYGIKVLRFSNNELKEDFSRVLKVIESFLEE